MLRAQRLPILDGIGAPESPPAACPPDLPHGGTGAVRWDVGHLSFSGHRSAGASNWAQRHGGWILSVSFHLILVCCLVTQHTTLVRAPARPRPVWLVLKPVKPPAPVPRPALETRIVPKPLPEPVQPVSTPKVPSPEAGSPIRTAPAGTPYPAPPAVAPASPPPLPVPPGAPPERAGSASAASPALERLGTSPMEQGKRIQVLLEKYGGRPEGLKQSVDSTFDRVDRRLMKAEVQQAASPFMDKLGTGGAGPERVFTFGREDPAAEKGVMAFYGIRLTRRHVRPSSSPSFLTGALGAGEKYQPAPKEGDYEVIEVPQRAQQQMALLEQQWLTSRGYSPRSTRVVRVEFGIVKQANGQWDLGILDIKVQPLMETSPKKE